MKILDEHVLDAPVATVRAMMLDAGFREQVLAAQKVVRSTVSITGDDDVAEVVLEQAQATDGVPSFVRKLTGDEITITTTERWSADRAEVTATIPGAPGGVTGSTVLVDEGERTRVVVERDITVSVPLIGPKIAKFVASMHTKALQKEIAVAQEWLAEQ